MLVSKINDDIHFAFHFLPIDKDIVTSVRNLEIKRRRKSLKSGEKFTLLFPNLHQKMVEDIANHKCENH